MKRILFCCLALSVLYLNGCASIVSSSARNVTITTEPDQATVEIVNQHDKISILKATTPHTLNMDASAGFFQPARYTVKLSKDGYIPMEKQLRAGLNGWYFGNVVFGGLLGILVIDPATGAMWKFYDGSVHAKLFKDTPEGRMAMAREVYNGREALQAQDYERVVDDTSRALAMYPEFLEGYINRSKAYDALGDRGRADADMQRVVGMQPATAQDLQMRGEFLAGRGQADRALADFSKALELDAGQAVSLFSRGQLHVLNKDMEKAQQDITAACQKGYSRACNFQF
ncbi:tetratricopeptide repeat protein [Trichlorobacter ammonificans]|uniref:Tetratricopeptide repeat-containing protein n=1 Tax=Trichlorobacter ammonificans TaxID=2916410 RepID=A0ABN8HMC2_9BACT|nr:hypothetical protein [Trichlorobacter ammonificans]CAH2032185.1 Tetratricopeptide repeat-containing protein [Trichlorobacter ammonificans]